MLPTLRPGQIVLVTGSTQLLQAGNVVVAYHHGVKKVKRIAEVDPNRGVFVLGDNAQDSTDSRSFGWLDFDEIIGRVIWPRL